jgi:hypothetical protein
VVLPVPGKPVMITKRKFRILGSYET